MAGLVIFCTSQPYICSVEVYLAFNIKCKHAGFMPHPAGIQDGGILGGDSQ